MIALPLTWAAIQAAACERAADSEDVPGAPALPPGELPAAAARGSAEAVPGKTPVTRSTATVMSTRPSSRADSRQRQATGRRCHARRRYWPGLSRPAVRRGPKPIARNPRKAASLTVVARTRPHEGCAARRAAALLRTRLPGGTGSLLPSPTPHHPQDGL